MKKLFTLMGGLLLCTLLFAQGGVDFRPLTFQEALKKAKEENKLVFVDCYTTWCGPCKHMTQVVFPQEKAGEFFNPRFVCVKFDMEKPEGKALNEKYGVSAYPTFLIVRCDGTVLHRVVGGGTLEGFIERVQMGLNEKTCLHYLTERYNSGKMKKNEMVSYYRALKDAFESKKAAQILEELQSKMSDKDKVKAEYWPLIEMGGCAIGSDDFNFILNNYRTLVKNVGKEKVDDFIAGSYFKVLSYYISGRTPKGTPALATLKSEIDGLQISQKEQLLGTYALANFVVEKDAAKMVELMEQQAETMTFGDFVNYYKAQFTLRDNMTKELYSRMLAVTEKVNAWMEGDNRLEYLASAMELFKKNSHVGVYFENLTFAQAVEKAKMNHQMVFVDCYTSWCGPCKYMLSKVFPQEKVGDYLNRFICVKFDMEKGEGPELAKRFGVAAFPTFLVIDSKGNLRHKFVGGGEPDEFIKKVEQAFDDTKATGVLEEKYKAGNRDHEFMAKYVRMLVSGYDRKASTVADELFRSLSEEERVSTDYWFLFSNKRLAPKGSAAYNYLMDNRDKFAKSLGKKVVEQYFSNMYNAHMDRVINANPGSIKMDSINRLKKEIVDLKLTDAKVLLAKIDIAKAICNDNQSQLLAVVEKNAKVIPGELFPVNIVYRVKGNITPAQQERWIKVLETVKTRCTYPGTERQIQGFVDYLK